ncbi:MAG: hypothetical protein FWC09_03445 [Lachnospiraceae bacterium]|nr:hypothetical protein [Lachnospiraceae bacterium]
MSVTKPANERLEKITRLYIFPLILFLFPLINMNKGVDLTDTGYSLANYVFFPITESSFVLNTYLSNAVGYFLTQLPFGGMMLGMKFYTALFVSAMALIGYRFFITKMPASVAFISEMMVIGLCWCPTVIIYNYLTYFFFLLGAILLFRGLVGLRSSCLVLAGVCLGLNVFVRNPNILEAALILCVWYYGLIRHKKLAQVVRETLLCLLGYAGAVFLMGAVMMIHYGVNAPFDMVSNLFQMSAGNSDYTFSEMIWAIFDAYIKGAKWLLYMVFCIIPGIPFLMVRLNVPSGKKISEAKIDLIKKVIYCLAIVFLFYALGRMGMYNFKYYQKEAVLQWAVIFLIISLGNMIRMLYSKSVDVHWKLIASIGIVVILITPLGSNNHIWPIINNLFFVAPITVWRVYRFTRYGRRFVGNEQTMVPLFPLKAMQMGIVVMVIVQSLLVGCFYVFRDGESGEKRNTAISGNEILKGMRTNDENAALLNELSVFMDGYIEGKGSDLILFGDLPALSYYLDRPSALSNAWADLDTFTVAVFSNEMADISARMDIKGRVRPMIIIKTILPVRVTGDAKEACLMDFIDRHNYEEVFRNDIFRVYF